MWSMMSKAAVRSRRMKSDGDPETAVIRSLFCHPKQSCLSVVGCIKLEVDQEMLGEWKGG